MSKEDKQNEDSKETITEETTQSESNDSSPIEETKPSTDTPIETKVDQLETQKLVLEELKKMQKTYAETLEGLKTELTNTKNELAKFQEEAKAKQPIKITALVKGKVDFAKKVADLGLKNINDYETHCRAIYDRINNTYPTINKLT